MFFLLPYGNNRQNVRFPAVTYSLMVVNVAMFLLLLSVDYGVMIGQFGLNPSSPTVGSILISMFVHAGVLHLGWNMLFLWLFGPNVEDALGHLEYLIFYLGSGFAAALMHIVVVHMFIPVAQEIPVVGASGAIAGVLGIFALRFYKTGIKIFYYVGILFYPIRWGAFTVPAMIGLGVWFAQQLAGGVYSIFYPMAQGVAYWSHIGGMAFGMLLAFALQMRLEGTKEYLRDDARSNLEKGTTWHAAEHLRALLEHDPDHPEVHADLAKTYALQQDPEHSITHYGKSIELYLRKGECEKAVAVFAELKHFYRNARLTLRSEFQLARHLVEAGCHEPALRLFTDIISSHPGAPEAEVAAMKAGDLYLNTLNNPECALKYYELLLREYPLSSWRAVVEKSMADARRRLGNRTQ